MVARWGGDPEDLSSFYVVADFRTPQARVVTKSDAALFVARELGWPWTMTRAARVLPLALRDRLYERDRSKPVSRLWPLRTMPDSE